MPDTTPAIAPLTQTSLDAAVDSLAAHDADLAASVARYGHPPMWAREPGFPTLVHIVLEQQVRGKSSAARPPAQRMPRM